MTRPVIPRVLKVSAPSFSPLKAINVNPPEKVPLYVLSLHDALPISNSKLFPALRAETMGLAWELPPTSSFAPGLAVPTPTLHRKTIRMNASQLCILSAPLFNHPKIHLDLVTSL